MKTNTGIKDKNGKLIKVGDVLAQPYFCSEYSFNTRKFVENVKKFNYAVVKSEVMTPGKHLIHGQIDKDFMSSSYIVGNNEDHPFSSI